MKRAVGVAHTVNIGGLWPIKKRESEISLEIKFESKGMKSNYNPKSAPALSHDCSQSHSNL